jgi:predicted nucleic acid-binding protein
MMRPGSFSDLPTDVVADASIVINLSATGRCEAIIDALPNRVLVIDTVEQELEEGRARGRTDAVVLSGLKAAGRVSIVGLDGTALNQFRTLVEGPAAQTLDDGEAATLAYAVENSAVPLIDERKANNICAQRFPALPRGTTVDLLAHSAVMDALGAEEHREAVFNALYHGKMRVLPQHQEWVVGIVGAYRASCCNSLPRYLRTG